MLTKYYIYGIIYIESKKILKIFRQKLGRKNLTKSKKNGIIYI